MPADCRCGKAAMDLAVHLEQAVRRFPRYHKYILGTDLRRCAARAWPMR